MHRLTFDLPTTAILQKRAGLLYDNTLLFAEHEGFRNSFCLPFKLYDFAEDRMIDHWMIPLNVMDSTLFNYRKLDFAEAFSSVMKIIDEIKYFNGTFSLLWHNGYFDEAKSRPGLRDFYIKTLQAISDQGPSKITEDMLLSEYLKPFS